MKTVVALALVLVLVTALAACRDVAPTPPFGCAPMSCEVVAAGGGGAGGAGGGGGGAGGSG